MYSNKPTGRLNQSTCCPDHVVRSYKSVVGQTDISLFHSETKRTTLVLVLEIQGSECLKHSRTDIPMDIILGTKWKTATNFCLHQNRLEKGTQVGRFDYVVKTKDEILSWFNCRYVWKNGGFKSRKHAAWCYFYASRKITETI